MNKTSKPSKRRRQTGYHSSQLHVAKIPSGPHCSPITYSKLLIFAVILTSIVIVIIATICAQALTPERLTKYKITQLASAYYETYLFDNISNVEHVNTEADPEKYLESYHQSGFAIVSLRQLLLHDYPTEINLSKSIGSYCDENKTAVKFYPKPPYSKTSYDIEYFYSCDF